MCNLGLEAAHHGRLVFEHVVQALVKLAAIDARQVAHVAQLVTEQVEGFTRHLHGRVEFADAHGTEIALQAGERVARGEAVVGVT